MDDLDGEMDSYWLKGGNDKAGAKGQEILDTQMDSYWAGKPSEDATTAAAEPPAAPVEVAAE